MIQLDAAVLHRAVQNEETDVEPKNQKWYKWETAILPPAF
jgi:hypothetical protein